ncbi:MAG TPA: aldo/keto reductase [Phycisphaerales bacterium]|nr:aldo/keto reductase [Phycisphaerales bacterium]
MSGPTRREFLMTTAAGLAAGSVLGMTRNAKAAGRRNGWLGLEKRRLGRTDMDVTVLGFGGAEIGYGAAPQADVDKLLNSALDEGLDAIDTAECYAESEVLIGNAVSGRRKDYYLFTKVGHWAPEGVDGWSAEGVMRTIERSLQRLKTDYVDLVHLHSCGVDVLEKGEAIAALERAKEQGKTRYIGYSGDSKAAKYAVDTAKFDTLMTSISVFDQEAIDLTLPACREQNMGVIVKRGIGNAVWRYNEDPGGYHAEYYKRMKALDYDFTRPENRDKTGPDGPAGIALRFILALDGVHTNVVGTTNPDRFAQNAELLKAGPLPPEQVEAIRARWKEVAEPGWVGQT